MRTEPLLSPLEQERLVTWLMAHPQALREDTVEMPWRYRHHHIRPAFCLGPRAWVCVHVLAGLVVAFALGRR